MYKFQLFIFLLIASLAEAQEAPALAVADSLYAVGNYSAAIMQYETIQPKKESGY